MIRSELVPLGGRQCKVFSSEDTPVALLLQLVSERQGEDMDAEVEQITSAEVPFAMVAVPIADWEQELMPWAEPAVSKRPEVGTRAGETLRYITGTLLPSLFDTILHNTDTPIVLGGYSLGGLFALWAACQTDRFTAVAAGSPSLWAGDWPSYSAAHPMLAQRVYLSLGDREERSRNHIMARVGDRIRYEYARLQQQLGEGNTTLRWEQGGHFADPAARMARAFVWCLEKNEK